MATKLTVPADSTADLHHHAGGVVRLPVTDSGSTPLVVRASVRDATPKALHHPAASWVTGISPGTLRLAPGRTGYVTLTLKVPRGVTGTHYTNVIFTASPTGAGTVRLAASVGGTLAIRHPGTLAVTSHPAGPGTPPARPAGSSWWPWLVLVLVLASAVVAYTYVAKVRRAR